MAEEASVLSPHARVSSRALCPDDESSFASLSSPEKAFSISKFFHLFFPHPPPSSERVLDAAPRDARREETGWLWTDVSRRDATRRFSTTPRSDGDK